MSLQVITTSPPVSLPAGRDIINANFATLDTILTSPRAASLVWCGPAVSGSGAPTFRLLVATDLPDMTTVYQPRAGNLDALASASPPTTTGLNFLALTNPGAITFTRINADNTVSALSASAFRTAIGAGTSNFDGAYSSLTGAPAVFDPSATPSLIPVSNLGAALGSSSFYFSAAYIANGNFFNGMDIGSPRSINLAANAINLDSASVLQWFSGANFGGTNDLTLRRMAAKILGIDGNGAGLQLKSPDGTAYNATIANGGTWAITPA